MIELDQLARKVAAARQRARDTRSALEAASFAHQGAHEDLRAAEAELDALIVSRVDAAAADLG